MPSYCKECWVVGSATVKKTFSVSRYVYKCPLATTPRNDADLPWPELLWNGLSQSATVCCGLTSPHFKCFLANHGQHFLRVKEEKDHPLCHQRKLKKPASVIVWGSVSVNRCPAHCCPWNKIEKKEVKKKDALVGDGHAISMCYIMQQRLQRIAVTSPILVYLICLLFSIQFWWYRTDECNVSFFSSNISPIQ